MFRHRNGACIDIQKSGVIFHVFPGLGVLSDPGRGQLASPPAVRRATEQGDLDDGGEDVDNLFHACVMPRGHLVKGELFLTRLGHVDDQVGRCLPVRWLDEARRWPKGTLLARSHVLSLGPRTHRHGDRRLGLDHRACWRCF